MQNIKGEQELKINPNMFVGLKVATIKALNPSEEAVGDVHC